MNPAAKPEKVYFAKDVPVEVALADVPGHPCNSPISGPSVMYTLVDGRVMYLPERSVGQLRELNPEPGERFLVTMRMIQRGRKSQADFEITPLDSTQLERDLRASIHQARQNSKPQQTPVKLPAAAATNSVETRTLVHATPSGNGMANALKFAIDATIEATAYAQAKGLNLAFDSDAIRNLAVTVFIGSNGGRS